ncbi:hypothetical protein TNCV_2654451 [Trichonephila clavipes]|nr:hypothetical protein TNCV_2654451 [Trichonephila clavipes]
MYILRERENESYHKEQTRLIRMKTEATKRTGIPKKCCDIEDLSRNRLLSPNHWGNQYRGFRVQARVSCPSEIIGCVNEYPKIPCVLKENLCDKREAVGCVARGREF